MMGICVSANAPVESLKNEVFNISMHELTTFLNARLNKLNIGSYKIAKVGFKIGRTYVTGKGNMKCYLGLRFFDENG